MTQFEEPAGAVDGAVETAVDPETAAGTTAEVPSEREDASPMAAALAELDTLPQRELAEHPEVYQRIHAELQSALATIDNA